MKGFGDYKRLIDAISYPGFSFEIDEEREQDHGDHSVVREARHYVRVACLDGKDNDTQQPYGWRGRKWRLSPHMTDGEVVQTCYLAVVYAEEHERRERFKFYGTSIFQPHYDIWALLKFAKDPTNTLEREHAAPTQDG